MSAVTSPQNPPPPGVDETKPSVARAWDYYLGGFTNFEADRQLAKRTLETVPDVRSLVIMSRRFLGRAIRHLAGAGVDQFLDLGSGIPTAGNVHEIAQRINPAAKVVYVDHEPVAYQHGKQVLRDNDNAIPVLADLRDTDLVLQRAAGLLDFDRPVALLFFAVLHFIPDDPYGIVRTYRDATVSGSHLVLAHFNVDDRPDMIQAAEQYKASSNPLIARTREEISGFFDGYDLLKPGLVPTPSWRPEEPGDAQAHAKPVAEYVGAGIKR